MKTIPTGFVRPPLQPPVDRDNISPRQLIAQSRGRSSVVERHVANVNVEGSTPFARFKDPTRRFTTPGLFF
jgi:hypothetical protein